MVEVQLTPATSLDRPPLVEPLPVSSCHEVPLEIDTALLRTTAEGTAKVIVSNSTWQACCMEGGSLIGNASVVNIVDAGEQPVHDIPSSGQPTVGRVQSQSDTWRNASLTWSESLNC